MPSYNKTLLMGHLTRDPDLRVTPKGTTNCQFGLAVNRQFKDESGATKDEVTFIDVEAWGKQAETIAKYCTKGKPLFIEGRLKLDSWEDKTTGQKRQKLKVVLESFQFVGGGEKSQDGHQASGGQSHGEKTTYTPGGYAEAASGKTPHSQSVDENTDVPF